MKGEFLSFIVVTLSKLGCGGGFFLIVFSLLTLLNRRGVATIVLEGGNENGVLSDPLYSTSNSLPNRKKPSLDR